MSWSSSFCSSSQSGKAMLSVEKDGDSLFASAIVLSGLAERGPGAEQWFNDSMENVVFCDWLPDQCNRMENGDKMILKVNFEQNYYKGDGYTSDDDEELIFTNVRKLYHRRGAHESRKVRKKYYQPKSKRK